MSSFYDAIKKNIYIYIYIYVYSEKDGNTNV